ncbi:hypothetical protein Droror1_Dr00025999 [Drosera rotundifolia]
MNDLFSASFSRLRPTSGDPVAVQMTPPAAGVNLDRFFLDVENVKEQMKEIDDIETRLNEANDESKTLTSSRAVKELRARMESDVALAVKKAKIIKVKLEALDRANAANRNVEGCGPGSTADRTRTSVVAGLRKKLKEKMDEFSRLRERIGNEYRDTVGRRYFTVTGENADEKTLDLLISTGESESFLQKAIQQQGRGTILDMITEIQERHDAVKDIERNLKELHQVFSDMALLVEHQGAQVDDVEAQVRRANSFVTEGTRHLGVARKHQKNTRKWTCYGIILVLVIILIIVLSLHPWKK